MLAAAPYNAAARCIDELPCKLLARGFLRLTVAMQYGHPTLFPGPHDSDRYKIAYSGLGPTYLLMQSLGVSRLNRLNLSPFQRSRSMSNCSWKAASSNVPEGLSDGCKVRQRLQDD